MNKAKTQSEEKPSKLISNNKLFVYNPNIARIHSFLFFLLLFKKSSFSPLDFLNLSLYIFNNNILGYYLNFPYSCVFFLSYFIALFLSNMCCCIIIDSGELTNFAV